MTEPKDDPIVGLHYKLYGYVSRGGIIAPPFEAAATFTQIMQQRPNDCRFAVARRYAIQRDKQGVIVPGDEPTGPYVVWDLQDDQLTRGFRTSPSGMLMPPPPMWTLPGEDGALMKAVAFYEHHP